MKLGGYVKNGYKLSQKQARDVSVVICPAYGPSKTLSSVPRNKMGEKGRCVGCGQHVCPTKCILDNGFIEMHHAK